jgi:hypothetical protein
MISAFSSGDHAASGACSTDFNVHWTYDLQLNVSKQLRKESGFVCLRICLQVKGRKMFSTSDGRSDQTGEPI